MAGFLILAFIIRQLSLVEKMSSEKDASMSSAETVPNEPEPRPDMVRAMAIIILYSIKSPIYDHRWPQLFSFWRIQKWLRARNQSRGLFWAKKGWQSKRLTKLFNEHSLRGPNLCFWPLLHLLPSWYLTPVAGQSLETWQTLLSCWWEQHMESDTYGRWESKVFNIITLSSYSIIIFKDILQAMAVRRRPSGQDNSSTDHQGADEDWRDTQITNRRHWKTTVDLGHQSGITSKATGSVWNKSQIPLRVPWASKRYSVFKGLDAEQVQWYFESTCSDLECILYSNQFPSNPPVKPISIPSWQLESTNGDTQKPGNPDLVQDQPGEESAQDSSSV